MCPSSINISVHLLQGDGSLRRRMKRKLWRLTINAKGATKTSASQEWQLCTDHPATDVIPPPKVYRGPIGIHDDSYMRCLSVAHQRKAIRVHRIAAMERCHFHESHKPFSCPAADCDAFFEQPEAYTSHAIETKHDITAELPEHIELAFAENKERLDQLMQTASELERPFLEWWGKYGSEERRLAEEELIHQLEHDPSYAQNKPVTEHPKLHAMYRCVEGGGL